MKKMGFALLAVFAFAACGKKDDTPVANTSACAPGFVCQAQLPDAKAASDYYKQFKYEMTGDCKDIDHVRFGWLAFVEQPVLATAADGSETVAELNLFLNEDGTYSAEYQENVEKETEPGVWDLVDSKNQKTLNGSWQVREVQDPTPDKKSTVKVQAIDFSSIGLGRAAVKENLSAVAVTMGADLNAALKDQTLALVKIHSKISKDGKTAKQVCDEQAAAKAGGK